MNIERLKKRKKELGWTLDEIAERSGISRRTVSRLFSGNPNYPSPTINTLQAIERALGLDKGPEWTEEEKALGEGLTPYNLRHTFASICAESVRPDVVDLWMGDSPERLVGKVYVHFSDDFMKAQMDTVKFVIPD